MKIRTRKLLTELMAVVTAVTLIPGAASASIIGVVTKDAETEAVQEIGSEEFHTSFEVLTATADAEGVLSIQSDICTIKVQAQAGELVLDAAGLSVETADGGTADITLKGNLYYASREVVTEGSCAADAAIAVTHFGVEAVGDGSAVIKAYADGQELDPESGLFLLIIDNEDETEAVTEGSIEAESETGTEEDTEMETEVMTEEDTEAESEAETETESGSAEYLNELIFENEEVKITVTATDEAQLPMDTKLVAEKLAEDSEEYLEAKAAADAASEADSATSRYSFYNLILISGGQSLDPESGTVSVQMTFKNIKPEENSEQNVFQIEDTENGKVAENITDITSTGDSLESVNVEV